MDGVTVVVSRSDAARVGGVAVGWWGTPEDGLLHVHELRELAPSTLSLPPIPCLSRQADDD